MNQGPGKCSRCLLRCWCVHSIPFLQVTELLIDLGQATNMNWYRRNHVGWHAVTNCIWSYDRHHDIMRTLSYNHTHTIIHIQAYTYNHSMMLHTGMWRIPMRSSIWNIPMKSCTDPWSLRLHRCSSADWLSDPWPLRLSPVQFTRVMVGSLVLATATHAVPDRESGFAFFITSLRPCHLCCRVSLNSKPTPSWQFDISPQALRSSFCFNLVVFRLVRLRIVPFSVPCCPSYFCFGLRCAWLNRFWLCIKRNTVTCCCLPTRFADQSSRVCPCFSFRPQCRDVSIWRFRFLRSCCVEWFSRWLVLRLFPLPCHIVCHTFVLARAALDRTGYASNSALSVVFLCQHLLDLYGFCNDWYWTPISALRKHLKKTSQKHKTNFSNISKTLTKLLKHAKDTKQTSQTSRTQNKHLKHHKLCNKGVSYMYFMIKLSF